MLKTVDDYIAKNLVHSIHNSGAKSFQGCRRRWSWIQHDLYYPTVTAKPLEFGVAFHAAMEEMYNPIHWHDRQVGRGLALGTFSKVIDKQYLEFKRKNAHLVNAEVQADYKERKELGLSMLKYYADHVSLIADKDLTPVQVEVEFEVAIKGPNDETIWCKCDNCWKKYKSWYEAEHGVAAVYDWDAGYKSWRGLPVTFGGRIDCLMMDQFGRVWIYDWKTAARLSGNEEYLALDTQITWYCWALWSIGYPVAGFIYAELKKAVPVEPEPNKTIRLGRRYSVSKNIETNVELYVNTVRENDGGAYAAGLYDEFIQWLKADGPKYHQRFQIGRNANELRNAGLTIFDIASDMTDPNIRIYSAPGKFNCQYCAFYDPCLAKNRGEDYQYTLDTMYEKRERHYYETEKSTEKRGGE